MRILAIETSCDETAAAIVEEVDGKIVVITNIIASQIRAHAASGGVVPELAARLHTENLPTVLNQATDNRRIIYDAVAVTVGPGLIGSLLIGVAAAKTIAQVENKPFFAINHLEGHIYSAWLEEDQPDLPALAVIVSGGHSELVLVGRHLRYQLLGATRDDAAGEAFDKVARLLGLTYPGGPALAELAKHGQATAFKLPISLDNKELEFSFSGLKGAMAHLVAGLPQPLAEHTRADLAASFQATVAQTINKKVIIALAQHPTVRSVILAGGVAANHHLRQTLEQTVHQQKRDGRFFVPEPILCTDNAAMIGAAAVYHHLYGRADNWRTVEANPNLSFN